MRYRNSVTKKFEKYEHGVYLVERSRCRVPMRGAYQYDSDWDSQVEDNTDYFFVLDEIGIDSPDERDNIGGRVKALNKELKEGSDDIENFIINVF